MGNYPNNLRRTNTIEVEEGLIVVMQFTAFVVESCGSCGWCSDGCCDHVTIKNGDGTTLMEKTCGTGLYIYTGGQYIGSSLPAAVTSTSNKVEIYFHTDYYDDSNSGWRLTWRAVTPGSFCPDPTPPTPPQPCSQLPGALECTYESDTCCCGRCSNFICVYDNSTSDSGLWQMSSLCRADGCGSEGK